MEKPLVVSVKRHVPQEQSTTTQPTPFWKKSMVLLLLQQDTIPSILISLMNLPTAKAKMLFLLWNLNVCAMQQVQQTVTSNAPATVVNQRKLSSFSVLAHAVLQTVKKVMNTARKCAVCTLQSMQFLPATTTPTPSVTYST